MTTIDQITADFELLGDWDERYRYIIELGRQIEPLPDAERTEANKVRGCASQVWLWTRTEFATATH
jgi:cysteine desulfuration protein SufE